MSKKQDNAVKAIDNMLHNLKKPKPIPYKDIVVFYQTLEEKYDKDIETLEKFLEADIEDEQKFAELKKISDLLEINIF